MNSEKELDRLSLLKIIEKRYSFLFEDVWFILLQYIYFEKFVVHNSRYLAKDEIGLDINYEDLNKSYWLMSFNLIFTALIGLGGLTTIPFCFKKIKQGETKTRIFYSLTLIQIIMQTVFPCMRAVLVILQVFDIIYIFNYFIRHCALVGFQDRF